MARFYSIDAANERLIELRPLLEGLKEDRELVVRLRDELRALTSDQGNGHRGAQAEELDARLRAILHRMEEAAARLDDWSVQLRDIETGLVDFPAMASGRPIWLCWRLGEPDVGWWHEMSTGLAGRKRLAELT